jgi:AAHS family 4-hydroxybenzoate transporter-like MFS transporter
MAERGTTLSTVNIGALIDRRVGLYQAGIVALCFLLSLMDGLDSQITSVTAGMMARDLALAPDTVGLLLSASQVGSLLGALGLGFAGDRWGRRPTVIFCALLFSIATLATAWANNLPVLLALRLLTGLGIGGAVPCFLALAAEFAPRRHRAGIVSLVFAAVPSGGIIVGLLGAFLLSGYGWRAVYGMCSGLSLLVCVAAIAGLPESPALMIQRGAAAARIRRVATKLAPDLGAAPDARFTTDEERPQGVPVARLFTERRAPVTLLLWLGFFIAYLVLIGTLVWTPGLMKRAGLSVAGASLALTFNNIGAIVGILCSGQLVDRFRASFFAVLGPFFLGGAVATILLGQAAPSFAAVAAASAAAGFCMAAGLSGLYALAALVYPTDMRSTGIGWASACGRVGSSSGPYLVGLLVAAGVTAAQDFLTLGVIAAADIAVIAAMSAFVRRRALLAAAPA